MRRPHIPEPRRTLALHVAPIDKVISQVACMSPAEQEALMKRFRTAHAALAAGWGDLPNWSTMADMCNLAEALVELRIGSNLGDDVALGQAALSALMGRVHAGAGWSLDGAEMLAIGECMFVYETQLKFCSRGEHKRAEELVRRRINAALRAGPGRTGKQLIHAAPPSEVTP